MKRSRPADDISKEQSAWEKKQEELQEKEMDLKELQRDLKQVNDARKMENNPLLSSDAKTKNSHLRDIEENYPDFFDQQDDPQNTNRGLDRVEKYLKKQEKILINEIKELRKTPNQTLDDLPTEMPGILEDSE